MKIVLLAVTFAVIACGSHGVGGPCDYTSTAGTCTVTHVSTSSDGSDPTTFDFATTGTATTSDTGTFENGSEDANHACSVGAGLTLGSKHACTLHTLTSGPCGSMSFTLDGFDPATTTGCH